MRVWLEAQLVSDVFNSRDDFVYDEEEDEDEDEVDDDEEDEEDEDEDTTFTGNSQVDSGINDAVNFG